tara:strand:+ start:1048 stop:1575 length:528 start_codon:yes stop_codon:yes gene_type:complete
MDAFSNFQATFLATVPVGARVWVLCDDNKYRLWSTEGGYKIKAKRRKYVQDPTSETSYPGNLIPSEPAEYDEFSFPRELASGSLAVPPKYFPSNESGRNGEAALSVTTVVPASPATGGVEQTKTCYYFGYEPGTTTDPSIEGNTPYNQFTVDSNSLIQDGSECEKIVMDSIGGAA